MDYCHYYVIINHWTYGINQLLFIILDGIYNII